MSSRNLLPIYCIPYSRCRYDFSCGYRYGRMDYQIITMHIAHIEIFCTCTHRVLDSYHYNAEMTFFVVFLMSLCIITI